MSAPAWTTDQRARARTKLPALYDAAERAKDLLERLRDMGAIEAPHVSTRMVDEVVHDITDIINEIDTGDPS